MIKPFSNNTVKTLWNDPYISKKMLEYHLDFSNDIASRNKDKIIKTVKIIDNLLNNKKSTICDFGCGPGLYTDLLQQLGHTVYGVDFSHNSIEYAKSINKEVTYIESNYLDVKLNNKFDMITMIYCDFSVLSGSDVNKLLLNIKKHLKEDGILFFDVHNLHLFNNTNVFKSISNLNNGFYMEGDYFIEEETIKYNKEHVILRHIKVKGIKELELFNWYKCYSKKEITKVLKENGFTIESIWDNTYNEPNEKSIDYCIIAKLT